jgi:hypothetical protein
LYEGLSDKKGDDFKCGVLGQKCQNPKSLKEYINSELSAPP